jgi:hypothetical protein
MSLVKMKTMRLFPFQILQRLVRKMAPTVLDLLDSALVLGTLPLALGAGITRPRRGLTGLRPKYTISVYSAWCAGRNRYLIV